ncbi:MAG: lysine--tRNA ligase [Acidimicrobiia bacterium]
MTEHETNIPVDDNVDAIPVGDVEGERVRRLAKLDALRAEGTDPYPVRFDRTDTASALQRQYVGLEPGSETDARVRVAGRIVLLRRQGKLSFATLRDGDATIQLFVSRGVIGEIGHDHFNQLDLGDWVGAEGMVMTTKRGELSIKADAVTLLAKALRPLPDKWHGLADTDARYRQRYADLIANEDARRIFRVRFAAIDAIRAFLRDRSFIEVETPVLHVVAGGATARPFATHHHALDMPISLRIALELHLKRLIVGGLDRVFELGRVFRNEGLSTRHNPEFTMLELYQAFADYTDMMDLTEALISEVSQTVLGTTTVGWEGVTVDLAPSWPRRTLADLVHEYAGERVHPNDPIGELRAACARHEVKVDPKWSAGKLIVELYEETVESKLVAPTFVLDYPRDVSPLARVHRDDPALVERFELIVAGRELANAYSELNDPVDQMQRFVDQAAAKAGGDLEANDIDEDYVRALEFGMPPTGGLGIGIDRLVMLLAGVSSIREVVLFPHLRPEVT